MVYVDAHMHLQDPRFEGRRGQLVAEAREAGVTTMIVNGTGEHDWSLVSALQRRFPDCVVPSYGLHPWWVPQRSTHWLRVLCEHLDEGRAALGEAGLDRWKRDLPWEGQLEVCRAQLGLAQERQLPISLHCLQAWGPLMDLLRDLGPFPQGFLLHSYGGSVEMVPEFAALGAYFSFPGYFALARKQRQRETFCEIPLERLLVETDAPDQLPPEALQAVPVLAADGAPLNHPANLPAICLFLSELRGMAGEALADAVQANARHLFGALIPTDT